MSSHKSRITIVRRLEFDMGHTVTGHEAKCRHLHGHRYTAEIHCSAPMLDKIGRVIDFGVIKKVVGGWIDDMWDHKFVISVADKRADRLAELDAASVVLVDFNPTAENLAAHLKMIAHRLLSEYGITVHKVRLFETPNGWACAENVGTSCGCSGDEDSKT